MTYQMTLKIIYSLTHKILNVFFTDKFMNINSQKQNLERIHAKFLSNFLLGEGILVFMDIQRDFELYTLKWLKW